MPTPSVPGTSIPVPTTPPTTTPGTSVPRPSTPPAPTTVPSVPSTTTIVPPVPAPPETVPPVLGGEVDPGDSTTSASTPPRRIELGTAGPSRAVSAPSTDPLSLIERDGGLSVKLTDGHQLWLFADTAVVINGVMTYFSNRGSGAISVGGDPYTITEPSVPYGWIRHPATPLISGGTISCPAGYNDAYWPSSAVAVPQPGGGDWVYVFYQALCGRGDDQGSYYNVSMGVARYDYYPSRPPSLEHPIQAVVVNPSIFGTMPGHSGPGAGYGTTSMLTRGMLYTYGCAYSPVWQSCRVARVDPLLASNPAGYRYWNGADWVASASGAVDLDMPNSLIGIKGSVSYIASVGLYAFADNDFPGPQIAVRWARDPEGPWTAPAFVNIPDCTGPDCWAAEVHGSLSSGANLAISYYATGQRPGMRVVQVPMRIGPVGAFDSVASWAPNQVVIAGWAADPDTTGPIDVHVYVDGAFRSVTRADRTRPGVPPNVGFSVAIDGLWTGPHAVCFYGINVGLGSSNDQIGCATFTVVAPFAPATAVNGDGRLEVFASDAFGGLVHAWQLTPGGVWSAWQSTGRAARATPVVARNGDGRLEIFVVDNAGVLVHQWQLTGQGWSTWQSMGVPAAGTPAVGTNVDGRLELFVTRSDGRLLHAWQVPLAGWSGFVDSGVSASASPEMSASADGRLEVFVTSGDGGLLHSWQTARNGSFSAWRYTGTFARGMVDAERSPDGRLELFATTPQNQVVHSWQVVTNGAWSDWAPMGLTSAGAPVAGKNADNRLEVFATDPSGVLGHAWQIPGSRTGWSWWDPMGLAVAQRPAIAVNRDARMALFAITGGGHLVQANQTPGVGLGWSPWRTVTPGLK